MLHVGSFNCMFQQHIFIAKVETPETLLRYYFRLGCMGSHSRPAQDWYKKVALNFYACLYNTYRILRLFWTEIRNLWVVKTFKMNH